MEEAKTIRIFLSSPGDVQDERDKVHAVANQLNRMIGDRLGFRLDVLDWNMHVTPEMGRPQGIINKRLQNYDIFIGVMWKRFGTPTGVAESGTKEEFDIAYENWKQFKRPRILFYFNQEPFMPTETEEMEQFTKVLNFKKELQFQKGICCEYKGIDNFKDSVLEHLTNVLYEFFPQKTHDLPKTDFTPYLKCLKGDCTFIDIKGLATGEGKAHQFRIDELYIPLRIQPTSYFYSEIDQDSKSTELKAFTGDCSLDRALVLKSLIIRGEPGAGKTTFMRLLTFTVCANWLGETVGEAALQFKWPEHPPLPVYIKMGELTNYINHHRQNSTVNFPVEASSPQCLLYFLASKAKENSWKLTGEDFRRELENGQCLILLDGLDEAPDEKMREQMSELAANILKAYPDNQVVLTSRPAALSAEVMPAGFALIDIQPLDNLALDSFLTHWCTVLYKDTPDKAVEYQKGLTEALSARPEIRRMARTPVMLTALAVVYWNEHRLPEQRHELYESILHWLFRARKDRPGRLKADTCRLLLQKLALAMFLHPDGRRRIVPLHWAAEAIANDVPEKAGYTAKQHALYFLHDEIVDSGIIVKSDNSLQFWHLSFQEYLAAYEIAGLVEKQQEKLLLKNDRLFSPEWRETLLLLAGILHKQGVSKVDHLVELVLKQTPTGKESQLLPQQARSVALLGGIQNDLSTLDYKPDNPDYHTIIQRVEGIFDKQTFRSVPAKIRSEAADALALAGDPRFEKIEWIKIPAGEFCMGAQEKDKNTLNYDPDAFDRESPVHKVKLTAFQMSKYPVTVVQFKKFIEADGYKDEQWWTNGGFGDYEKPSEWDEQLLHPGRPVTRVNWYEAAAFAMWNGSRLPTEAEWEYAARGTEYRKWPWGDKIPDEESCNWSESKLVAPSPVGIFPENVSPFGLLDMAGNVDEWCADWYGKKYYGESPDENPQVPETGDGRVLRGGSWSNFVERYLRCSFRINYFPVDRNFYIGFRVARSLS